MTYNVFSRTLNPTQSNSLLQIYCWHSDTTHLLVYYLCHNITWYYFANVQALYWLFQVVVLLISISLH